jgi:hypothetical protein
MIQNLPGIGRVIGPNAINAPARARGPRNFDAMAFFSFRQDPVTMKWQVTLFWELSNRTIRLYRYGEYDTLAEVEPPYFSTQYANPGNLHPGVSYNHGLRHELDGIISV